MSSLQEAIKSLNPSTETWLWTKLEAIAHSMGHENAIKAAAELALAADEVTERVVHERQALADAIYEAAIESGIANREAPVTGPHLIMFCADMSEQAKAASKRITELEQRLTIIVEWLEQNQPDVFRRGIWDAIGDTK